MLGSMDKSDLQTVSTRAAVPSLFFYELYPGKRMWTGDTCRHLAEGARKVDDNSQPVPDVSNIATRRVCTDYNRSETGSATI